MITIFFYLSTLNNCYNSKALSEFLTNTSSKLAAVSEHNYCRFCTIWWRIRDEMRLIRHRLHIKSEPSYISHTYAICYKSRINDRLYYPQHPVCCILYIRWLAGLFHQTYLCPPRTWNATQMFFCNQYPLTRKTLTPCKGHIQPLPK